MAQASPLSHRSCLHQSLHCTYSRLSLLPRPRHLPPLNSRPSLPLLASTSSSSSSTPSSPPSSPSPSPPHLSINSAGDSSTSTSTSSNNKKTKISSSSIPDNRPDLHCDYCISAPQNVDSERLANLPIRIILVRHGESEGNIDVTAYTRIPDRRIQLTPEGMRQAEEAGLRVLQVADGTNGCGAAISGNGGGTEPSKFFVYVSPYDRSKQTLQGILRAVPRARIVGVQEEVQLREQDFGNFQDAEGKRREMIERQRFSRFFYRFPNGESGADVYDRITVFEDHLIRDMNAGRFGPNTNLLLVTHGLALRIFLMRWFHWSVDEYEGIYNPPNSQPLILQRKSIQQLVAEGFNERRFHTKEIYELTEESMALIPGCTHHMCSAENIPQGLSIAKDF